MTLENSRPAIPDVSVEQEELGLALKTIGGALLIFDCLVGVFVPIGIRNGSLFWMYWVVVQAVLAFIFIGYGLWLEHVAASRVGSVHPSEQSHY